MPKIIENLKNRILIKAEEAFIEKGFEQVDMRSLAEELGIAVGTLYNYYRSKGDLYLAVLTNSWENTFYSLKGISNGPACRDEKLCAILRTLALDVSHRRGLGQQLQYLQIGGEEQKAIIDKCIMEPFSDILQSIFSYKGETSCLRRCVLMAVFQLPQLVRYNRAELEDYLIFIKKTIQFWLEENPNEQR
ncbi:MAG: hypothetical protein B6241_04885 [Spirochaetaceae bacterium 4572_59]|nr:MAG: hypothetical protein B6241_04885 [Spirochaetaceae bacterium 4572_59]